MVLCSNKCYAAGKVTCWLPIERVYRHFHLKMASLVYLWTSKIAESSTEPNALTPSTLNFPCQPLHLVLTRPRNLMFTVISFNGNVSSNLRSILWSLVSDMKKISLRQKNVETYCNVEHSSMWPWSHGDRNDDGKQCINITYVSASPLVLLASFASARFTSWFSF